jgi:hypothetical protein
VQRENSREREKKGTLKYVIDLDVDRVRNGTRNKTDLTTHENISSKHFHLFRGSKFEGLNMGGLLLR